MDIDDSLLESSASDTCANNQLFGTSVSVDEDKDYPQGKHVWYYKIEAFNYHVREINFDLIHVLGTCLSLDEIMIRFSGRSLETHQIKNKPIEEGYNFVALTTSQGFVANFTLNRRTASKSGRQESSVNSSDGEIEPMI
eukprot:1668463-Ditylum_brightwellii.AAC.1